MIIQKINRIESHNLEQTLKEVERLSSAYYKDMSKFYENSIYEVFDYISKSVRYVKDPKNTELVMRPGLTLKRMSGDCDDKTVLFLAWLKLKKIPRGYSIVSDSDDKNYHHIFPFCYNKFSGMIVDLDATYPKNKIANSKKWSKRKNFFLGDK